MVEFTASDSRVTSFTDFYGILADFSFIEQFHTGTFTDGAGPTTVVIFALVDVPV